MLENNIFEPFQFYLLKKNKCLKNKNLLLKIFPKNIFKTVFPIKKKCVRNQGAKLLFFVFFYFYV